MLFSQDIHYLKTHYLNIILPCWKTNGFNEKLRLPFEALNANAEPLSPSCFRAMACARQLYIFSQQHDPHAHLLFDSLLSYFQDKRYGGWIYSVDANGAPLNTKKDLYTHAFVIFACTEYYTVFQIPLAQEIVKQTIDLVYHFFAKNHFPLQASLTQNFSKLNEKNWLQNPLMHLTEALICVYQNFKEKEILQKLKYLLLDIEKHFVDSRTGCISEIPIAEGNPRFEPGHQFEWFSLFNMLPKSIDIYFLRQHIEKAAQFCTQFGIDPQTNSIFAALNENGQIIDTKQRIWAQTEHLRYLAIQYQNNTIEAQHLIFYLRAFKKRFIQKQGWIEMLNNDGTILRAEMPSTTPYHLLTALIELEKLITNAT